MAETGDRLPNAILIDREGVTAEGLYAASRLVEDGGIQTYLIRVLAQCVAAV